MSKADISDTGNPFILYGELYTTYPEITTSIVRKTLKTATTECLSRVGDVIIPTSGETPKEIATATCVMLSNVILAGDLIIYRNSTVDGRFISYIINHVVNGNILRIAQGKSVVHIKADELSKIVIHFPERAEQQKIIDFLYLLDTKIAKQRQMIDMVKSYKRGLENIIFSPKYSTVISVSDMLTECVERSTVNDQYPIISSTKQGLFMQSEYFNKQAASVNTIGYKILKIGQIVFSPQNLWMGNINYNNKFEIGIVSPSYKIYKINSNYDSLYIGYLLKSNHAIKEYILASEQGASIVRRNLDMQLFSEIKFSVPNMTLQRKFSHLLNEMDLLIQKYSSELTLLDKTKAYLLQQLFI